MKVHIGQAVRESLTLHAGRTYPEECCGVLLGKEAGSDVRVERAVPADNIAEGDRTRGYQVDWKTLFDTVRLVRNSPHQLVGFYHSHPTTRSEPSEPDRRESWPNHSYVIVAMKDGQWTAITSWRASRPGAPLEREQVAFTEEHIDRR